MWSCSEVSEIIKYETSDIKTGFELDPETTATYEEVIDYYKSLAAVIPQILVQEIGQTDSGKPLHSVIVSKSGFSPYALHKDDKLTLFVNNAIHPGEPCGVDASMMLARDLIKNDSLSSILDHVNLIIIPVYNVGGSLNRGSHSRANQVGPKAYGFRGNSKNLDLNRDFIKADSKNAHAFTKFYTDYSPDVFIDNHTSNGADYQYVLTLIATQKDKLSAPLADLMTKDMLPQLYDKMENDQYQMTPYVYSRGVPDEGIYGFLDYPRYSSGYTTLHNSIGFISETHMLKPYKDRVWSTYHFMKNVMLYMQSHNTAIKEARADAISKVQTQDSFALDWTIDASIVDTIAFKGYEAGYKPSEVTGQDRLYYDRSKPFTKPVAHFNSYKPSVVVKKPTAYLIPQAYDNVVQRLKNSGVIVGTLGQDTTVDVEHYYIDSYETRKSPYEAHFLHYNVKVSTKKQPWTYYNGDSIVYVNQPINRLNVETLEPQGADSFFAWNFFDGILMQKEYFSPYVFEDTAAK
jgi:hypothetical protein